MYAWPSACDPLHRPTMATIATDPIHRFTKQDTSTCPPRSTETVQRGLHLGGAHRRAGNIERNAKNRRQTRARTLIATRTARCHECPVLRVRGAPFHCGSMLRAAFPHRVSGDQNSSVSGGNESCSCRPNHRERTGSARGPPTAWGELVQVHDDRDIFQASHDELPAIDIHSL